MIRWKWIFTVLVIIGVLGVAGCSGKTGKEEELEKQVVELERQLEQTATEESEEPEVKLPAVINLIDPNTKQTVKTIVPEEIGYGTDNEKYKKEMEKIGQLPDRIQHLDLAVEDNFQKVYMKSMGF